jgi:hypothetical protein
LISGLKQKSSSNRFIILYWKIMYLIRWVFTIIILILLKDYPNLQILILLVISYIMQGLIATSKPFESKLDNIFAFLNEVSASFYLYIMMLLSDSNGDTTSTQRESFGWALTILMCAVCLINLIKALLILLKKICT